MEEHELVRLLQDPASKNDAFRILVGSHKERLYRFIRKMVIEHQDTDEVLQLTFIKAFKYMDGFKQNSTLFTWLGTIARREAVNFMQKKAQLLNTSIDELSYSSMQKLSVGNGHYFGDDIQLKLQTAVSRLPEKQREVFNMKYFDKLLFREIAEITGTSEGGLKANYHLAVKRLKELLMSA
jgi:RNA polymerase sigma-70 factor (ECF subfamily)